MARVGWDGVQGSKLTAVQKKVRVSTTQTCVRYEQRRLKTHTGKQPWMGKKHGIVVHMPCLETHMSGHLAHQHKGC